MNIILIMNGIPIFSRFCHWVANSNNYSNCSKHEHLNRQWTFFYPDHILLQASLSTPVIWEVCYPKFDLLSYNYAMYLIDLSVLNLMA